MTTSNIVPTVLFAPFKTAIGDSFDKVCSDTKAMLGRLEKDIVTKDTGWKVGVKGGIVSKSGHKLQLPLNNPMSSLILFALQLNAIAEAGEMVIESELPKVCNAWIAEQNKSLVVKA